jgi:citrate synthase
MTDVARGLEGVVLTESRLSMVDGKAGKLVIGGFPLEKLALQAIFEETLFLLWHDRLPNAGELTEMQGQLAEAGKLSPATLDLLRAAVAKKHSAMDALRMGMSTVGLDDPDINQMELQSEPPEANRRRCLAVVGAVPAIVAAFYRLSLGLEPIGPDASSSHAANYLRMLFGGEPEAARVRAINTYLNTTIDHGLNASTFTARVIASTRSDVVSSVVGALGALKGPLHGGAPGPALEMVFALQKRAKETGRSLEELTEEHVREVVKSKGRIMGFGHRVYRVRDPRADVLGAALTKLFPEEGQSKLYDDARLVEGIVLRLLAELKPHRPLYTNVEFYTALLLEAIQLPLAAFTPTFAVSRVGGWTAHVLEQVAQDVLIRPSSKYVGPMDRPWVPLAERS